MHILPEGLLFNREFKELPIKKGCFLLFSEVKHPYKYSHSVFL
jgi:hypothetical protein